MNFSTSLFIIIMISLHVCFFVLSFFFVHFFSFLVYFAILLFNIAHMLCINSIIGVLFLIYTVCAYVVCRANCTRDGRKILLGACNQKTLPAINLSYKSKKRRRRSELYVKEQKKQKLKMMMLNGEWYYCHTSPPSTLSLSLSHSGCILLLLLLN